MAKLFAINGDPGFRYVKLCDLDIPREKKMAKLFTNSGDPHADFRYVKLCDLDIPPDKWLYYLQTVETLIRRRFLWY